MSSITTAGSVPTANGDPTSSLPLATCGASWLMVTVLSWTSSRDVRGRGVLLIGTVAPNDPFPFPPAGEFTSTPESGGTTDHEQPSPAATSKDGLAPKAGKE